MTVFSNTHNNLILDKENVLIPLMRDVKSNVFRLQSGLTIRWYRCEKKNVFEHVYQTMELILLCRMCFGSHHK